MTEFKTIGKNEERVDIRAKVCGRAVYAADLQMPGMLHGKIVRCYEHAHARVLSLDLSAAAQSPGVVKVLGPEDVTAKPYNQSVIDLMASKSDAQALGDIEEQVAQARRYYNAVVRDFNTKTQTFPSVLIARSFGFTEREFFEVPEAERAVPKVSFGDEGA